MTIDLQHTTISYDLCSNAYRSLPGSQKASSVLLIDP